ncbi:hypothetical protein HNQ60_002589 [Povalibacter uvarum]|uniref:Uncharacterized protein n=1 Tax=Povalibacter uvarum TaxID=732238 RepID=A0A841HNH5_9GAMM|nr:hypothetical protein [Povalibacter uvarum]MBB6093708.1 hypothetical protein [Povalibacter uvarum]
MTIGASTWPSLWLSVLLLAVAASLSSYLLSRLGALRGMRPAGRLAIAGATSLFLVAVTIAVLSSSRWASLVSWSADPPVDEGIAIPGRVLAIPGVIPQEVPRSDPAEPTNTARRAISSRTDPLSISTTAVRSSIEEPPHQQLTANRTDYRAVPASVSRTDAAPPDIWGATRCVRLFSRNPDNVLRWTMENECDRPVGIAVTGCNESGSQCEYAGVVLPLKAQRFVLDSEETVYGAVIRFEACLITNQQAYNLIGAALEVRSTDEWRAQWAAVQSRDACLSRVLR